VNKMKNAVVLDCDGTVFDFEGLFCKKFGWERRHFVNLEMRYPNKAYEIELFSLSSRTYEQLDIIEMGVKIARFCDEIFDIHFVTNRPSHTTQVTGLALKSNKIPFKYLSVGENSKIRRIQRISPLFIVEDLLSVVEPCADLGISSFLIDSPWNQKDGLHPLIHRIKTFEEFLVLYTVYFKEFIRA